MNLREYAAIGRKRVNGWLSRIDAEIFRCVLELQNAKLLNGSVAEIGVHEGKAFVALCLGLKLREKAYCIDVFHRQELNVDHSGKGNEAILRGNLAKFGIPEQSIVIDARSSEVVQSADIVNSVGQIRFFSVDGGHWHQIVVNDLNLADQCLAEYGVAALDDFQRAEWPEVSAGYFEWSAKQLRLVPLAIGFNKLYLCRAEWAETYEKKLRADPVINEFWSRDVLLQGRRIPVFKAELYPELSFKDKITGALKSLWPTLFLSLLRLKGSLKRRNSHV